MEISSSLTDDGVIKYIPPDMILPEKTKRLDVSTDISSGSGIVTSAKYRPTELDVPSFNDTDASAFKGDVGNMLILVGKQADFTTVTANNNPYS